jgi:hypothetical protein
MTIRISHQEMIFDVSPFSKKHPIYPIPPSRITDHLFHQNVIRSQILRTWRISTNIENFSKSVNQYLEYLCFDKVHMKIRSNIFHFLQPLKISTHKWNTDIPLCNACTDILFRRGISIAKIFKMTNRFLAVKEPCNCETKSIHILQKQDGLFKLILVSSLHQHLSLYKIQKGNTEPMENFSILPIGRLSLEKVSRLLQKHPSIEFSDKPLVKENNKRPITCRIHTIFKHPYKVYGLKTLPKKSLKFDTMFNDYKKISRRKSMSTEIQ